MVSDDFDATVATLGIVDGVFTKKATSKRTPKISISSDALLHWLLFFTADKMASLQDFKLENSTKVPPLILTLFTAR